MKNVFLAISIAISLSLLANLSETKNKLKAQYNKVNFLLEKLSECQNKRNSCSYIGKKYEVF